MKKRILSIVLTLCMVLMFVPQTVFAEGETSSTPSVSAYATKAQLMDDTFAPDSSGNATNIGKLVFGKNSEGFSQQWYILGKDNGVSWDNTIIFAASPIATRQMFEDDPWNNKTFLESFGAYDTNPSEVLPNHYGASDLRGALQSMAAHTSYFTSAEQGLMNDTTVTTKDTKNTDGSGNYLTYTTTDKLYALAADGYGSSYTTIKAGSDNSTVLAKSSYWSSGGWFWLRSPHGNDSRGALLAYPGRYVSSFNVSGARAVQPASNLNLSSVLFASAATAAPSGTVSGTITDGTAMILRLDGSSKNIGAAIYNAETGTIEVRKGTTTKTVALVVQGNDGTNNWYYSKKIDTSETINVSSIETEPNIPESIDLSDCKIWLETTDTDGLIYAVGATGILNSVAITGIEAPAVNTALSASASCATEGVSSTTPQIMWTPSDTTARYNTSYTASITLTADTGYEFADTMTATVNGKTATSVTKNDNGTLTITYTFPEIPDTIDPVISGVEEGKTYCSAQTVTVSDNDAINTVTVNGAKVTLDEHNQFTLSPASGEQMIIAIDNAGNSKTVTVTVNNGHTADSDDGNCSTPVYCIYHPDTIGIEAKSHDFSGELNKDKDGHWHICQNAGCTVTDAKVSHSSTDDGDCTTAVECECGYIITAANANHTFGEWQSNGNGTHTRYCTVDGCNGYEDGDCDGGEASYFKKAVCDICHAEYGNLLTDSTAPTGEITVGTNKWGNLLNTITFGIFFKNTQSVTITASDDSYSHAGYTDDKAVKVEYYLHSGDTALTKTDLASKTFTAYNGAFNINPDNKYVVYAKLTDFAGNVTYISSEGVVLDGTAPVISSVENGKTYCEAHTVTVTEAYIKSVTVNGTEVTLDANNQFALNPADGTQTIVATDHAGNSASVTVTVNNGHTYEWHDDNGQYWKKCQYCGNETAKKDIPTITINGADAVCVTQDYKFSFTLPEGATDASYGYEFENKGDSGLTAIIENNELFGIVPVTEYEPSENSFKVYAGAKTADGFEFFVSKTVVLRSEHTDTAPKDHICDICGATLSEHSGGEATCTNKAICEYCGNEYGELDSSNHNLEKIPAKAASVTETGNNEYWCCLDCGKYFADENGTNEIQLADTVITKLPPEIIEGKGQSITAGEKKELTFRSNAAFSDFIRAQLDGKTIDDKNYAVKEGSTIVTLKADYVATLSAGEHTIGIVSESGTAATTFTVNAKAENNNSSPQTGDNNNIALWIALLFVSGGAVLGTTVVRKKKKHSKH